MAQVTLPQAPVPLVPQNVLGAENRPFTVNDLPPAVRAAFPGLKTFNRLQVTVAGAVLQSDDSLVVNAPTGSGKTVILELAIVKLALECAGQRPFRVIYLAPTRSLCAEKFHEWRVRFAALGIGCVQYDGDNAVQDIGQLAQHQLILSTPEKWEVFTRHWGDQLVANVLRPIRLFLIDEIQVMDDGVRGANLELVVSRMKYIDCRMHRDQRPRADDGRPESIRFIAVSACIPNVDDIACWLKSERKVLPFSFAETFRATHIGKHVIGFPCTSNPYKFELDLSYKLPAIIDEYARQKPTLVFCSSRKSAEMTAQVLARSNMRRQLPAGPILAQMGTQIANKALRDCVAHGVAYHHAGLLLTDRNCIESHFRSGHLAVLCCTSTLCMGVNLPAYLVIIKSTFSYAGKNYSDNYILQMMGRAGRAQYNEDGVAVILTADEHVEHYRKLVAGTAPVESQLHHRLPELLNSEITHGIIHDQPAVMEWMRSTFFYVRARTNPSHYNLGAARGDIEDEIEQLCRDTIDSLEESGLIQKRRPNALLPTVCGKLMTRNHLSFWTMRLLQTELKGTETLQEMLLLVTRAHEFSEYKCRNNEKRILNSLNAPGTGREAPDEPEPLGVRFRWPGRISSTAAKVYCLVQAVFGNLTINDHGMHQEAAKIVALGVRIGRCILGLLDANGTQLKAGCFGAMVNTSRLVQCFQAKLWHDSPFVMKQLDQIGPKLARHLADRGKVTFQAVRESDPRELECILKKQPPFGNDIISFVDGLPHFSIKIIKTAGQNVDAMDALCTDVFTCTVTQRNEGYDPVGRPITFSVLVGDSANRLLLQRTVECTTPGDALDAYTWPIHLTNAGQIESLSAHLICQDWVGLDCSDKLYLGEPPVATKHKQTTITHFFPNQSAISNNTTLPPMQGSFPIPSVPVTSREDTGQNQTVSDSFGIASYLNQHTVFNGSNDRRGSIPKGISFLNRDTVIPETTMRFNDTWPILGHSLHVPIGYRSIRATLKSANTNLSSWQVANTSGRNNGSLMNAVEAVVPPRNEMFETTAMFHSTNATIGIGNTSYGVLPRPAATERLPIRSILKRPAATLDVSGTEAFRNSHTPRPAAINEPSVGARRRSRPHFRSEEFRHMFREHKCTQSFPFCSPAEDILDCFKRYNIFMAVDGMCRTWTALPCGDLAAQDEPSAARAPSPVARRKKNFDLGLAENVICLDEE